MPDAHARLAPSAAHRWMYCPASPAMEAPFPDTESRYAQEGKQAHALLEAMLTARISGVSFIPFDENDEMQSHIEECAAAIWDLSRGKMLFVEKRVNFSEVIGVPSSFGTADVVIVSDDRLEIHDLKYGRGVKVEAKNNAQLLLYALGAFQVYGLIGDINYITLAIHQPRLNHQSYWEISRETLFKFAHQAKQAAQRVLDCLQIAESQGIDSLPSSSFNPSENTCRFCKARAQCRAYNQHYLNLIAQEFVDMEQPVASQISMVQGNLALLTPEKLAEIYGEIDMIESWCNAVRQRVRDALDDGQSIPGYKLVYCKPGNRQWRNEKEAKAKLLNRLNADQIFTQKLISPKQAEVQLKKNHPELWAELQSMINRTEGKPVVVPVDDPRCAIEHDVSSHFDVLE